MPILPNWQDLIVHVHSTLKRTFQEGVYFSSDIFCLCHFWTKLLLTYRNQRIYSSILHPQPQKERLRRIRTTLLGRKTKWKVIAFSISHTPKNTEEEIEEEDENFYCQTAFTQKQCICLLLCICMRMILL